MKTLVAIMLLALFVTGCETVPDKGPERITWSEAVTLIKSNEVATVVQRANLTIMMVGRDGTEYVTTEPRLGAALEVIKEEDPDRTRIQYLTN